MNLTEGLVLGANSIWIQNYQWNGSAWNEQEVTFNSFWSDGGENAYAGSSEGLYQYQDGSWVLVSGLDNSRYTIVSGAMVDGVPTLILADLCYVDGRYRSDKPAKVYGPVYLVSLEESGTKKTAVDVSSFSSTKDGYGKWFASGMGIDGKGDVYVFTVAYGVNTNQFGGYTSNYVYKLVDGEWQYQIIDAFNDEKDLATIEAGGIPSIDSSKSRADGVRYTLNLCDGVTLFLGEDGANYALYGSATITFDAQGGSEVSSITQTVGSAVTAPSSPTRDGYEFVGWYTDSSCSDDSYYLFDTMPVAGITLYAGWTALSEIQTDAEQELAEALAAYTESDYTAESWAKLLEAYEAGKTAIESGASNAEIQSALEEAVKAMAAITADAETEPSTEATEPSTEATEPTTEATEPTTEATDTASRPEVGDTYKTGNVKYTVTGTNTVTATKVTDKTVTSVKIPKTVTIDGYTFKVTAIGESAFSGCKKLTSVSIGANVTVIEKKAFYHCTALTSVTIPSSVTKIKASAFEGCTALKKLKGCASVVAIGQRAFRRCTELTTIEGLSKTTYLGNRVFAHCKKLKTIGSTSGIVNLPKVKTLKAYAFYDCPAMKQVNLTSSSLKTIGKKTFYECTKLATVQGLTKVTSIGTRAFYGCTKLVTVGSKSGVVTLAKVKTVDEYAFCNCSSMKKVNLTSTALTSLGASSFRGCTKLTSFISKSAKLASIGRAAFYGDKKLASVKLATSKLTKSKVGEKAFKGIKSTCVFKVPAKKVSAYRKIFRARGAGSKITVKKNA
ncbi:MAG: leucine-rich repeat protein [Lachnospiraceae bacterium]|nr:leucine-rich repeat protein [Lachnospiraceae bacterium]